MKMAWVNRWRVPRIFGLGALFSGSALLVHIITGVSLTLALLLSGLIVGAAGRAAWSRASPSDRRQLTEHAKVGLLSGLVSTLAYDLTKAVLSRWDPSPYNPFEAIRIFGALLVGPNATSATIHIAGAAFHFGNGLLFGLAFVLLFGSRSVLAGIGWGLFLELFQLTLYPGWLSVQFYREFVQISALSHLVYGAVLGLCCSYGLRAGTRRKEESQNGR
jgi:hypothetical protein